MDLSQTGQTFSGNYDNQMNALRSEDNANRAYLADRNLRAQQATQAQDQTMPTAPTALPTAPDIPAPMDVPAAQTAPTASPGTPPPPAAGSSDPSNSNSILVSESNRRLQAMRRAAAAPAQPPQTVASGGSPTDLARLQALQRAAGSTWGAGPLEAQLNPPPQQSAVGPTAPQPNVRPTNGQITDEASRLKSLQGMDAKQPASQGAADAPTQYDPIIQQAAQQAGVDPTILKRLLASESSFNPQAVSPRGAQYGYGIAQIAASHGLTKQQMEDPAVAIPFAANLLKQYAAQNGGDMNAALLQYKGASSPGGIASMQPIVAKILTGLAPGTNAEAAPAPQGQPAAAPQAPAAPTPLGPGQAYAPGQGSDYNFDAPAAQQKLTQLQQMFKMAQWKAQNAATGAEREQAMGTMQQLQAAGQDLHGQIFSNNMMQGVRQVEAGNTQALGQMIQAYSQNTGTPLVIHPVGNGQYALFTPDNKPVTQPGTAADLAHQLYGKVAPAGRSLLMSNAQKYNDAYQAKRAEADAKTPGELQLENLKIQGQLQQELTKGTAAQYLKQLEMSGIKAAPNPITGQITLYRENGSEVAVLPSNMPGTNSPLANTATRITMPGNVPR